VQCSHVWLARWPLARAAQSVQRSASGTAWGATVLYLRAVESPAGLRFDSKVVAWRLI